MGGRGGAPRSFFPEPETDRNIQTHTQAHKQMGKTMIVLKGLNVIQSIHWHVEATAVGQFCLCA